MQPEREGQLRGAERVREVDVEQRVAAARGVVAAGWRAARRVPEVGPRGLVDAGAGADEVEVAEGGERGGEHG